jgi:hypothetical protein
MNYFISTSKGVYFACLLFFLGSSFARDLIPGWQLVSFGFSGQLSLAEVFGEDLAQVNAIWSHDPIQKWKVYTENAELLEQIAAKPSRPGNISQIFGHTGYWLNLRKALSIDETAWPTSPPSQFTLQTLTEP